MAGIKAYLRVVILGRALLPSFVYAIIDSIAGDALDVMHYVDSLRDHPQVFSSLCS